MFVKKIQIYRWLYFYSQDLNNKRCPISYMKINNLYKNKDILYFKQAIAMEKGHGTSSNVKYNQQEDKLHFFSGGAKHDQFVALFNQEELLNKFRENAKEHPDIQNLTVYGESLGGKMQGMSQTYGPNLSFITFEVKINEEFLGVFQAEKIALKLGFEFIPYKVIDTTEEAINAAMLEESEIAVRRGMGHGKTREGIVLRPLINLIHPNSGRIISKHKNPIFAEREHTPRFSDPEQLRVLEGAKEIADEWVLPERLRHVLDRLRSEWNAEPEMKDMNKVIKAMILDIFTEGKDEIVETKEVRKYIGAKTAKLFQIFLRDGG